MANLIKNSGFELYDSNQWLKRLRNWKERNSN